MCMATCYLTRPGHATLTWLHHGVRRYRQPSESAQQTGEIPIVRRRNFRLILPCGRVSASIEFLEILRRSRLYRYAHDEPEAYATGERYFPDGMAAPTFYVPTDRRLEAKIRDKFAHLKALDAEVDPGSGEA